MSLWTDHQRKWKGCKLCSLCKTRDKVVLARGSLPCTVLFIGEAPGMSEDVIGLPFVGPAGKLLDKIISESGFHVCDHDILPVPYALTNLVCCLPLGEDGSKTAEPPKESIEACSPRLEEFLEFAKPKAVVCVGTLSEKWIPKLLERVYESGEPAREGRGAAVRSAVRGLRRAPQRAVATKNVRGSNRSRDEKTDRREPAPRVTAIIHPAAILRANVAQRPLLVKRCIVTLSDLLAELAKGES